MDDATAAAKLAAAIDRAGFPPGSDEGQRDWVLDRLSNGLALYAWNTGRDPDIGASRGRVPAAPRRTERKHLLGFIKAITAAREHLHALAVEDQIEVGIPPMVGRPESDGATSAVPNDPLQEFIAAAKRIEKERTGGRPADTALEGLLLEITVQYRCAFGPELGIVYSGGAANDAERYRGSLLDFAIGVLESHGVRYGVRSALGRRLYDLMTKPWGMSRHGNRPAKLP